MEIFHLFFKPRRAQRIHKKLKDLFYFFSHGDATINHELSRLVVIHPSRNTGFKSWRTQIKANSRMDLIKYEKFVLIRGKFVKFVDKINLTLNTNCNLN